jgi:hypothetical protein
MTPLGGGGKSRNAVPVNVFFLRKDVAGVRSVNITYIYPI